MPAAWVAAAGALIGGLSSMNNSGGGGGQGSTTTTGQNVPWTPQQRYLGQVWEQAHDIWGANPSPQYYPGQTVAGQSPFTQAGINRMAISGLDPNSLTNQSVGEFGKTVRGDYLDPSTNPYLKASVDDALGQVQGKVSGLYGSRGGNNYGSSAHEEFLTRNLAATALPIYAQNYQQERGRQLSAAQIGPQIDAQSAAGLNQAGQATDAYSQALINADKARYDFNQQSPWDQLQRYQSAVTGQYGNMQSQSNPYFKPDPLVGALGGAATGMGIYNQGKQAGAWGSQPSTGNGWNYNAAGQYNPYYSGYDSSGGNAYG